MWTDEDIEEIEKMHTERDNRLRMVLGDLYTVFMEVHKVYPNTSVCRGGIGGSMMTPHCSWECDNHQAHHDENGRLRFLLGEARSLAMGGAL